MKKILVVCFLFICISADNQVSFKAKLGFSAIPRLNEFAGVELQGSNIAVSAEFRPDYIDNYVYANGMGLSATLFLYPYQSSPFFTTMIITHGSKIDIVTGRPVRSMPISLGYRLYPKDKWSYIDDGLSFDVAIGVELLNTAKVRPYIQISGNFILVKIPDR